jgi:ATP-dependent DNA helicase DinG
MALPGGGERRDGQTQMAEAVARSIMAGEHVVVQAGTGTGKSLGYLIPSILSGKRVVVATATKALQDQLCSKDLPFLEEHLGTRFSYALLKGRSNYFCSQRSSELLNQMKGSAGQLRLEGATSAAPSAIVDEIIEIAKWAGNSPSGDKAELNFEPSVAAWSAVSVSASECPGAAKCPSGEICFAERARTRAADADVIVVNMHLYGQHIRSGGFVLPEHDVVILDEAHELEDVVADSLGAEISGGRFVALAGRLRSVVSDIDAKVDVAVISPLLDAALSPFSGKAIDGGPSADPEIRRVLNMASGRVRAALDLLRTAVPSDAAADAKSRQARAQQSATALADEIDEALAVGRAVAPDKPAPIDQLAWVEPAQGARGPVLRISPIEVGPMLDSGVWQKVSAVLTSATIPPKLPDRLMLPSAKTTELDVGSPFQFDTQGMLYCARHLPDPRHATYETLMHKELRALITAAGGRTLALFTSWKTMKAAVEACRDLGFPIVAQGELPKAVLVQRFADDESTCLFATMGFWQGIDVPGQTCSLVVIDKLPFSRPDEPLLLARRERCGPKAFEMIDLPRAATLLAQGVGRLIRTSSDRGVVAVLDPRLSTARYAHDLVRALPPLKRTRHLAEVEAFLTIITTTITTTTSTTTSTGAR